MSHSLHTHRNFLDTRRFSGLDGLRAISVLGVLWHHLELNFSLVGHNEFIGVDMFFVISGWLIVTLLLRERDRHGTISLGAFYARRTLRIFPLYYAVIAFLVVLFIVTKSDDPLISGLPWYLTYMVNWVFVGGMMSLAWSLAAEEQFYLVWPAVERFLSRNGVWIVLLIAIGINQLFNFDLVSTPLDDKGPGGGRPIILQVTFTPILLGVLIAHVMHDGQGYDFLTRTLRLGNRWAALIVGLLLVLWLNIAPDDIAGFPRLLMHILLAALLVAVVATPTTTMMPVLESFPMKRIGIVSYGVYLLHLPVFAILTKVTGERLLPYVAVNAIVSALLVWLVAELSFRFFEQPISNLRKHFAR